MISKPAFMARLPDSRVRKLPPLSPIREASIPGTADSHKPPMTSSAAAQNRFPQRQQQGAANVLKVDNDFPEEYRYLVTRTPPAVAIQETPHKDLYPVVQPKHRRWQPDQVDALVDHYLQSATLGASNPMEPQPNALCKCCSDINDINKRRQMEKNTHRHLHPLCSEHPELPHASNYKSTSYEDAKTQDYSADFGIFRTESPELLSDSNYHTIPEYEQRLLDQRKIFVTHPAKKTLYSNWGVQNELEEFSYDRQVAESVVQASSNFVNAMEKLKEMGSHD